MSKELYDKFNPTYKPMSCPAPQRASRNDLGLGWTSHPWTVEEVIEYRAIGGFFVKGWHDFADRAASIAAGCAPEPTDDQVAKQARQHHALDKMLESLTSEERMSLLQKLA